MTPHFERVCIIGVGLLGASFGLALKSRAMVGTVVGVGHRQSSLDTALECGAIDEAFLGVEAAVQNADLILVATPANLVIPSLETALAHAPKIAIFCDVASTKADICNWAASHCKAPRRFVGCHPMAGSEKFGPEHGNADFFAGHTCIIEDSDDLCPDSRETVMATWRALGANMVEMEPVLHDRVLARTSHIPHILAAAIATLAARQGDIREVIGNGYRDTTRIAAGRPEIWRDIVLSNANAIHEGIAEMQAYLRDFADAVESRDSVALERMFEEGRDARMKAVEE